MITVNKTAIKTVVNEVTEALSESENLAADIIADSQTKEVYAVYFTPSIYDDPKSKLPSRTSDTPTHRRVCTVYRDNLKGGLDYNECHFKFNQTDLLKLIEKVFA